MTRSSSLAKTSEHFHAAVLWLVIPSVFLCLFLLLVKGRSMYFRAAGRPAGDQLLLEGLIAHEPDWVEEALRDGASVNARDEAGRSALFWAAADGDQVMVRRLLARGANASVRSEYDETALASAADSGRLAVMEDLLAAGARADQGTVHQSTALHFAAAYGAEQPVSLLLSHGAIADARDADGRTPLMWAASKDEEAVLPAIRRLLKGGAKVNTVDVDGQSALMSAAGTGQSALVEVLLNAGADAGARDHKDQTAAALARCSGHETLAADLDRELSAQLELSDPAVHE
jgi:ankyrin repeat protein